MSEKCGLRFSWTLLTVAMSGAFAMGTAWADPTAPSSEQGLEEIVVTARKATENLQTTPVAVTALSQGALDQQQVFDVADLQHAAPDLTVGGAGTGPSSIVYLAIRGQAQNMPNSLSDASVGTYVDGVYLARPVVGNVGFLDAGQVEVLRGPQGTLFGRNTTGGALNISSNQPTDTFEGSAKVGYGNYNAKLGELILNSPIAPGVLDGRVAFRWNDHGSYYTNPINSAFDADELHHEYQGRASLKFTPEEVPLTVLWTYDYTGSSGSGTPSALVGFNSNLNLGLPLTVGGLVGLAGINPNQYLVNPFSTSNINYHHSYGGVPTNIDNPDATVNTPFNEIKAQGFTQDLDLDVGKVHVKSITAYRWTDAADTETLSGMPFNYYAFTSEYVEHQFSEELQLSGKAGKFDWIGGAYYFIEGGSERSDSQAFGFLAPLFDIPPQPINRNYSTYDSRSIAAFGQTNYHFTDTIRATVGYRYTWDQRDINEQNRNDVYGPPATNVCASGVTAGTALAVAPYPCNEPASANFSYPAWTAGLDWEIIDGTFVYLKTDKASMAGGFNTRVLPPGFSEAFGPESNMDVEGGIKADTLNHHLRTNLALFHGWQSNVQRIVDGVVGQQITQFVTNAGKTRTYGAELEVTALPWTGMEINLSGAYLHAAYVAGTFLDKQLLPDGTIATVDRSNEVVPQAPKFTYSLGGTQSVPLPFGKVSFHVDYAWIDKVAYTVDTASALQPAAVQATYAIQNALGVLPSYGLVNARIALNLDQPDMEFTVYGRNLANREYYTNQYDGYGSLGVSEDFQGNPRTFGVTATYHFK